MAPHFRFKVTSFFSLTEFYNAATSEWRRATCFKCLEREKKKRLGWKFIRDRLVWFYFFSLIHSHDFHLHGPGNVLTSGWWRHCVLIATRSALNLKSNRPRCFLSLKKKKKKCVDFDHKNVSLDFTFWRRFHFHLRLYIAFDNISFIIFSLLRCIPYKHQSFILYQWEEEEKKTNFHLSRLESGADIGGPFQKSKELAMCFFCLGLFLSSCIFIYKYIIML